MSLQLFIKAKEYKNSFAVFDVTGDFGKDNETGWGKPNIKQSNVTKAYLDIYLPCNSKTPFRLDVTGIFPNDNCTGYEILPPQLQSKHIKSGKYIIRYTVEGKDDNGNIFKEFTEIETVFVNHACCVVDKALANAANTNFTPKGSDKKTKSVDLSIMLENAKWAANCCPPLNETADKLLCYIQSQCINC